MFAKIKSAIVECPACGSILELRDKVKYWRGTIQRAECPWCQAQYQVGIVLWAVGSGHRGCPQDIVPTARQRQQIREQLGAVWVAPRWLSRGRVNLVCLCDSRGGVRERRQDCPVHGGPN